MSNDSEEAAIDQLAADLADPIIERISQDAIELRAEVERLATERDAEIRTGQKYRELGSSIFAEINALAEQALGHPIEPGHTAAYAVELLVAENARLRQALEAIAGMKVNPTDGVDWHGFARRLQLVAAEALATPGERGGA